jgi:hypothetical protein
MNIREFAALKVGDKVELRAHGYALGTVSGVTPAGVRVVWGARGPQETPFFYSVNSTSWMQWEKVEADPATCDRCGERIGDPHKDGCPAGLA